MLTSADINKALRPHVSPLLRHNGFDSVDARNGRGWHDHSIWVLCIRGVGWDFSRVTDWPTMSLSVWVGVYFDFIPFLGHTPPPVDAKGRIKPNEGHCHLRSHLTRSLDQGQFTWQAATPIEQTRRDIWWVQPDGSNLTEVVENIGMVFLEQGLEWFRTHTDPAAALGFVEAEHDCYFKFYRATFLSIHLRDARRARKYRDLWLAEAQRINHPIPAAAEQALAAYDGLR